MPRCKASLIEAHREVRGFHEQRNFHGSQSCRNGATPRWRGRRNCDLSASPASKAKDEPQRNGTENNRQHDLAEHGDNGGARSRQRNARDIDRDQEAIRNTALECRQHLVRQPSTLAVNGPHCKKHRPGDRRAKGVVGHARHHNAGEVDDWLGVPDKQMAKFHHLPVLREPEQDALPCEFASQVLWLATWK